uniref:Transposase n=1 Tax=Steinernema glaseri TaxID=37863 RepID=A0A1I7YLB7_9BILA
MMGRPKVDRHRKCNEQTKPRQPRFASRPLEVVPTRRTSNPPRRDLSKPLQAFKLSHIPLRQAVSVSVLSVTIYKTAPRDASPSGHREGATMQDAHRLCRALSRSKLLTRWMFGYPHPEKRANSYFTSQADKDCRRLRYRNHSASRGDGRLGLFP